MQLERTTALVIHDDADALDGLTRLFEGAGLDVIAAITGFRAQAHLEAGRPIHVVVAPWDAAHPIGGDVYRWSIHNRYDLRDSFVFLADEVPPEFDRVVAGRCLAVSPASAEEVLEVARAAVRRRAQLEAARDAAVAELDGDKPSLLIADDDPILLMVMADLFAEAGYAVTRVESGHGAIGMLDVDDYDAIVADWSMDDGNGADLYRWIVVTKPWLAERVVFLAGEEGEDPGQTAPGRPIFRKGADSDALRRVVREIARQARGA